MKEKGYLFYLLSIVLCLFPFFCGGYYIFYCSAVTIVLLLSIVYKILSEKNVVLSYSISAISILLIGLFYLLTRFWAVDKSMSFEGFIKFLAPLLFMLNVVQLDDGDRRSLLNIVPISATLMTLISYILGEFERFELVFHDYVGDLHGCFEYANAYAMFVLLGFIIAIMKEHNCVKQWIFDLVCAGICIFGIIQSGSRAVYALSVAMFALIVFIFVLGKLKTKKLKLVVVISLVAFGAIGFAVCYKLGYVQKIYNYVLTDGSIEERILYSTDSLRFALKHPFGKGAFTFYFTQPKNQSAYYYAIDVHNDYMQLAVEVGIIPTLVFVGMLIYQLFNKNNNLLQKMVLIALSLHCFFDYDLQFTVFWFILILCLSFDKKKEFVINNKFFVIIGALAILLVNSIIGLSNFYNYTGHHDKSLYYYKNTPSMLVVLVHSNDQQTGYELANEILDRNDYIFEANQALSNIYAENDRYDEAIEQMELVLDKSPRKMEHYKNYIDLLVRAKEYYDKENNVEKSADCVNRIIAVPDRIKVLEENTPERAKLYGRKQNFNIGKKYKKLIESYERS